MRKSRFIIAGVASLVWLNFAGIADAQYNVGLYKNGQLINTLGSIPIQTNAPSKALSAKVGRSSVPLTAVAPLISADAQARNQVFADSAMLGIQIRDTLRQIQNPALEAYTPQQAQLEQRLADLLHQLSARQPEVRAAFDSIATRLVELKLPPEILQRHFDAVAANEAGFAAFTSAVNNVLSGKPGAVDAALKLLDQIKLREEPDLTRRGPTHQAMPILSAPQLTREQADALLNNQPKTAAATVARTALGSIKANLSPPTGNDLAETPDVQLTSAIRAKAVSLGNSPEAIYEFVRNKVKFQPYLGSRKGAAFTLQQLAGNDTDQASLLIALLRAANIPCRYVRGTVEMTPTQATSWLGVDDLSTAANILSTAGLNGSFYGSNVRCTRIWVEAYVPYSNYRGVPNDQTGLTWIPLDPAFKLTTGTQGQDVLSAMGYNNDAFLAGYVSTYNSNSPIQSLTTNIQIFLNTNQPGKRVADIERTVATQPLSLGLLPASLPVNTITAGAPFSALDDTNRFKIRFNLYNGGTSLIDYTTNLCQLVGHQVTISYIGATPADQATINAHHGIFQTPPYLVNVKPVLKLDGNALVTATNSIGMGYQHNSDMYFTQPAGDQKVQPVIYNYIIAGNSQAIGFDTFMDVANLFLAATNSNSLLENLLNATALDYLSRSDRGEEEADRLLRTVHTVDVSEAILESSVSVLYSYGGVPQTFTWTGMTVDADRHIVGPFGANGDNSKVLPFMKLTGYDGSFMENDVFEDTYAQRAVSTIRILQWSHDQGIPTCYITNSISSACPGFSHSSSILSAVNNALAQGHVVIIPRQDITIGRWSGTGYIDMDPASGAAGYIISGGISGEETACGGSTVDVWPIDLGCEPIDDVTGDILPDNFSDGDVLCPDDTYLSYDVYLEYDCEDADGNITTETFYDSHTVPLSTLDMVEIYGPGTYTISIPDADVDPVSVTIGFPQLSPMSSWTDASSERCNNCYNYATDIKTGTFAQPGQASGHIPSTLSCPDYTAAAEADGLIPVADISDACGNSCFPNGHIVALVIWPGVDFHWYRMEADGTWTHKPGETAPINLDQSGKPITDPRTADRGGYTEFCGFFCTSPGLVISGAGCPSP